MISDGQLKNHYYVRHNSKRKKKNPSVSVTMDNVGNDVLCNNIDDCNQDCNDDNQVLMQTDVTCEVPVIATIKSPIISLAYFSDVSSRFFHYEVNGGNGLQYLTALSVFNNEALTSRICRKDALLHFNVARLCFSITRGNQKLLCFVLSHLNDECNVLSQIRPNFTSSHSFIPVSLPRSLPLLRSQFLEGKYAYLSNIPCPLYELIGNCLYVSLVSCVAYVFAMGIPIFSFEDDDSPANFNVTELHNSAKARKIYNDSKRFDGVKKIDVTTFITEWSDAFDPNTSTKNNRESVFVKTITFPRSRSSNFPASCYTFPVCIGSSKADRWLVDQKFASELECFKKLEPIVLYDAFRVRNVSVYLDLLCSLQDQPERRPSCYLMMGNSRTAPRWGYSLDYKSLSNCIKSRKTCITYKLDCNVPIDRCSECTNWEITLDSELLHFPLPKGYPNDSPYVTNDGKLRPTLLTTSFLKSIVNICYDKLVLEIWTDSQARAFLCVYGINKKLCNIIINHAKECIVRNQLRCNSDFCDQHLNVNVNNLRRENSVPIIPPTWLRNTDVLDHVEAIMHLLFLGIVKSVLTDIHTWMKKKKTFTKFLSVIDNYLSPIERLKLSWCKIVRYGTGSFGGHVSENYLAMARILKWFVCFTNIQSSECDSNELLQCTSSLYALLGRCLQREVSSLLCDAVLRHVKIFLNNYAKFDGSVNGFDNVGWIKNITFYHF
jgi:hypothetical protein